jgi:hypothetical protein
MFRSVVVNVRVRTLHAYFLRSATNQGLNFFMQRNVVQIAWNSRACLVKVFYDFSVLHVTSRPIQSVSRDR